MTLQEIEWAIEALKNAQKPHQEEIKNLQKKIDELDGEKAKLISPYRIVWIEPNGERFEYYTQNDKHWSEWTLRHQLENRGTFGLHYREIDHNHYEADNEQGHWLMKLEDNPLYAGKEEMV